MATVLTVEDEPDLRRLLRLILERAGHQVIDAPDGPGGLRAFHQHHPDLVLLDVGLPGLEGWTVLERIRELSDTPVLMLTARGFESDKLRGLNGGADDYVTKPFSRPELMARVNALLRRSTARPVAERRFFIDGGLEVDLVGRVVRVDGHDVALTPLEYRLLLAFVRHPDQILSLDQLLEQAWDDPLGVGPDRVKFAVMRLRRKLSEPQPSFTPIQAVRGFGYRFRVSDR